MKTDDLIPKELLDKLGIVAWGYTEDPVPTSFEQYKQWTEKDLHGPLAYLNDHRKELRSTLKNIFPSFQSALVFLFGYQGTKKWMIENQRNEVAAYTLGFGGGDYHFVLKERLKTISEHLQKTNSLQTFITLDTQPVLERDLAHRAGLGWFGKNSMLIHQKEGSYFIIGSLLLDAKLALPSANVDVDHCGQCNACVEACPTQAIDPITRTLVASSCISTYTIEVFKDAPAPIGMENSRTEVFGCDICQDVCPWNRRPLEKAVAFLRLDERFSFLRQWFYEWPLKNLQELFKQETNRGLKKRFQFTVFERPGREGWLKNLRVRLSSNRNDP